MWFMNMKENFLFLRNEWTTTGEVDKTDRTREMYSPIRWNTRKKGNTSAFDKRIVFVRCKKIDNNKRRKKQRRRQTRGSWYKNLLLLLRMDMQIWNVIGMTKIRQIFKWADRGKHWTSKQTRSTNSMSVLAFRKDGQKCAVKVFKPRHAWTF